MVGFQKCFYHIKKFIAFFYPNFRIAFFYPNWLYVCAFTCPHIFNFERLTKLSLLPTLHFMKNLIIVSFFIDILMVCFNASYNSHRMKQVKLLYHLDWNPNLENRSYELFEYFDFQCLNIITLVLNQKKLLNWKS